jgi:hypothetical protein
MPNVKLPTGVDLYYESHGHGEALIFVPSTAYSGEVWKPSQMPLASSLNLMSPSGMVEIPRLQAK